MPRYIVIGILTIVWAQRASPHRPFRPSFLYDESATDVLQQRRKGIRRRSCVQYALPDELRKVFHCELWEGNLVWIATDTLGSLHNTFGLFHTLLVVFRALFDKLLHQFPVPRTIGVTFLGIACYPFDSPF
jgi:hypothetical protein